VTGPVECPLCFRTFVYDGIPPETIPEHDASHGRPCAGGGYTWTMVDAWPTEEDMAEACGCGHLLGQHAYGDEMAPCDHCPCRDFHDPSSCASRAEHGVSDCADHWLIAVDSAERALHRGFGTPG
jgi:hypothetical protein